MRLRSTSRKLVRLKYPQVIRSIEKILKDHLGNNSFHLANTDGRINSIYDENMIIRILEKHYGDTYVRRPTNTRHWYDVKVKSIKKRGLTNPKTTCKNNFFTNHIYITLHGNYYITLLLLLEDRW